MTVRRRILFIAEDITLSQVVRLRQLAQSLDPARYEVTFACARFPELIFAGTSFTQRKIYSISGPKVLRAVERGTALYDAHTLGRYVAEEIALLRELRPDLVVGDLRLSLSVSAPTCGVPYASLGNAFWHRRAVREHFPVPDFPILRWFPEAQAQRYFATALPFVLRHMARPVNALRRRHGLPAFADLIDVMHGADHVLLADVPEIAPIRDPNANEHYLGPVLWSPTLAPPERWSALSNDRPCIYVTLGSSGSVDMLDPLLHVLGTLDAHVMLATAGRFERKDLPANVHVEAFAPGAWASAKSDLVICNGGASTAYQALAAGTPVLGLPANIDQWLAMNAIESVNAGKALRMRKQSHSALALAISEMLTSTTYKTGARKIAHAFSRMDSASRFATFIEHTMAVRPDTTL